MNENKELDTFIKKMVKEAGLESPSANFTHKVLGKIQRGTQQSHVTIYQPLISRTTWILLALVILSLFGYLVLVTENESATWFSILNVDFLSKYNIFALLANTSISETLIYSTIGLSIIVYIQLFLLKRYMDIRLSPN